MLLLIDNYDSFTHNLAQQLARLGEEPRVLRNDAAELLDLDALGATALVVSPGPGRPAGAGASLAALRRCHGRLPILGVCLGHQALAEAFGGRVVRAARPLHGRTSTVHHSGDSLFRNVRNPCEVARYHSLVVDPATLPARFRVTARSDEDEIMAIEDAAHGAFGIQFHPESFLTPEGDALVRNFLEVCSTWTVRST